MITKQLDSIWTPTFAFLCLGQFLGYAQHSILTPTFPLYVTHLGGSPFMVGLVLGAFAVTSVVLRPLIGHWADRWDPAGVMISGLLFLGFSLLFSFVPLVAFTILANGLRGIGWAGLNTGGYTLLALSAPEARRGEASGYYSGVQSSATILFPAVALWLTYAPFGGFNMVFAVAVALAILGAGAAALMARHLPRTAPRPKVEPGTPWWRELFDIVDRDVFLPSVMLFWLNLSLPSVTSFIVLYAREIGIENFWLYFVVSGATSVCARPLLGRASDKIGRGTALAIGFTLQMVALSLLVTASSLYGVLVSGALYMLGNATGSSATLALAVERANPQRRGKAMATFSVAYPLSYGVGSLMTGSAADILGYVWTYLLLAGFGAAGVLLALANWSRLKS